MMNLVLLSRESIKLRCMKEHNRLYPYQAKKRSPFIIFKYYIFQNSKHLSSSTEIYTKPLGVTRWDGRTRTHSLCKRCLLYKYFALSDSVFISVWDDILLRRWATGQKIPGHKIPLISVIISQGSYDRKNGHSFSFNSVIISPVSSERSLDTIVSVNRSSEYYDNLRWMHIDYFNFIFAIQWINKIQFYFRLRI